MHGRYVSCNIETIQQTKYKSRNKNRTTALFCCLKLEVNEVNVSSFRLFLFRRCFEKDLSTILVVIEVTFSTSFSSSLFVPESYPADDDCCVAIFRDVSTDGNDIASYLNRRISSRQSANDR